MKLFAVVSVALLILLGVSLEWNRPVSQVRRVWQQAVSPGELSQSHRFLENNCAACHTPVSGVTAAACVVCHADNDALLQRQPTAFHANVPVCTGCHLEHQGSIRMTTTMDHALLSVMARRAVLQEQSDRNPKDKDKKIKGDNERNCGNGSDCDSPEFAAILQTLRTSSPLTMHNSDRFDETTLDCMTCHATKDRHQGLFGRDCVQCHTTTQWTNPAFVHPSVRSTECAQCHKPPPSHNMMHFNMVSAAIAKQPNASVNQCHLCHQSTSWNDIKGAGWVKHH